MTPFKKNKLRAYLLELITNLDGHGIVVSDEELLEETLAELELETIFEIAEISNDIVQLERESIWSNIDTLFEDEDESLIYVDAWVGNEDEGNVIAKVNSITGDVIYLDERAKTDRYAQNMISELVDEIKKK